MQVLCHPVGTDFAVARIARTVPHTSTVFALASAVPDQRYVLCKSKNEASWLARNLLSKRCATAQAQSSHWQDVCEAGGTHLAS